VLPRSAAVGTRVAVRVAAEYVADAPTRLFDASRSSKVDTPMEAAFRSSLKVAVTFAVHEDVAGPRHRRGRG